MSLTSVIKQEEKPIKSFFGVAVAMGVSKQLRSDARDEIVCLF